MPKKKTEDPEVLVFRLSEDRAADGQTFYGAIPVGRVKAAEDIGTFGPGTYALFVGVSPLAKLEGWKLPSSYKFQGVREVTVPTPKAKIKEIA